MASEGGEKTEPATPRRRQEARKKGQVARSPELSGAVALFAMVITLHATLGRDGGLLAYMQASLGGAHTHLGAADPALASAALGREALRVLFGTVGLAVLVGGAFGLAASVAQVGFLWTTQPLVPDPNRINPMAGAARLLGSRGMFETAKAVAKMVIIGVIVFVTLRPRLPDLVALITLPDGALLAMLGGLLYALGLRVAAALLVLALCDYAYQRWDHEKSLRMSKEEIKQEHKQSEGDPHIKHAIRQRQRAMARRRMMQDVPKADVVITNPTHFAVALAYDAQASSRAPVVLAKGADHVAAKIRELAREHDVALVEEPPLARALHKEVEVGQEIPPALYAAVAEVLAYVYDQDRRRGGRRNV